MLGIQRSADLSFRSAEFRARQRLPVRFTIASARHRAWIDRMSRLRRRFLYDRDIFVTVAYLAVVLATPQGAFAWGREGHQIIVIVAEHYMRPETAARMRELLAPETPEEASAWADEYRHGHRETGPWHCIDIRLADSKIDLARERSLQTDKGKSGQRCDGGFPLTFMGGRAGSSGDPFCSPQAS